MLQLRKVSTALVVEEYNQEMQISIHKFKLDQIAVKPDLLYLNVSCFCIYSSYH